MIRNIRSMMRTPGMISVRQFRQGNRWQLRMMSFVFAILLLFLHVFVMLASLTRHTADGVKQKLGVYFYIKDVAQSNWSNGLQGATTGFTTTTGTSPAIARDTHAERTVEFQEALEAAGAGVKYIGKDEALKNLQNRLPSMVKSFDQYGIDNPLPVTLYVTFQNQKQFDAVMGVKSQFSEILYAGSTTNSPDMQFQRNARVINLLQVLQIFFWAIVGACVAVILIFLGMIIKTKFTAMYQTINVQKLLGASYSRLKKPFFTNSILLLGIGYVMAAILMVILLLNVASVFPYLFGTTLVEVFWGQAGLRVIWLFVEFIILVGVSLIYANWELSKLLKKE